MARIRCFHCEKTWDLAAATTNRCPGCGWIVEIYYDESEAKKVVKIYNEQEPPVTNAQRAGKCELIGINGYSVSFPDDGRLAELAEKLLELDNL